MAECLELCACVRVCSCVCAHVSGPLCGWVCVEKWLAVAAKFFEI